MVRLIGNVCYFESAVFWKLGKEAMISFVDVVKNRDMFFGCSNMGIIGNFDKNNCSEVIGLEV